MSKLSCKRTVRGSLSVDCILDRHRLIDSKCIWGDWNGVLAKGSAYKSNSD